MKKTLPELLASTSKLAMVTAYDYPGALQAERAGVDLILVGDSLGNVVLGYESTAQVTLDEMIHHARAVRRGAPATFVVADMPFGTYHTGTADALRSAVRLVKESGADAVKLEGASRDVLEVIAILSRNGIPVMGHVGLLPQTEVSQGGRRVQGRTLDAALGIAQGALAVERAGAFAVVLEAIPSRLAELITQRLRVPSIGIGAGPDCRGQVLVYHDLVGMFEGEEKKLARRYAELGALATQALRDYAQDVRAQRFPTAEHGFLIRSEVLAQLREQLQGSAQTHAEGDDEPDGEALGRLY